MKSLKAYLFWYICGALFLAELVVIFVVSPTDDDGKSAEEVKTGLDGQFVQLKELIGRADRGSPNQVFNVDKQEDIDRLTKDYLITNRWLPEALEPQVKKYEQHYNGIKQDLLDRSAPLRQSIADSGDRNQWYTVYESKTASLLGGLVEKQALYMPKGGSADLSKDAEVRKIAGFFTRGNDFPPPEQHPLLTTRLHIMEAIIAVVLATPGEAQPDPAVLRPGDTKTTLGQHLAMIAGVEWDEQAATKPLAGELNKIATYSHLTLSLHGPEAAVLAVTAALEAMQKPVLIVAGCSLSRFDKFKPGERKTEVAPVVCALDLVVMDFTPIGTQPAVEPVTPKPEAPKPPKPPKPPKAEGQ